MKLNAACTTAVLAILAAGVLSTNAQRDYRDESLDLLRILVSKPWAHAQRWDRAPLDFVDTRPGQRTQDEEDAVDYDDLRERSRKRSAVATALNGGRRRRQPSPALGKASITPYVGVGVLSDIGTFFDYMQDNLDNLASLSPAQRSTFFKQPPSVVGAPSSGGGGGGGVRRFHPQKPFRPTRNNRSVMEAKEVYPAANHHDPGLLWTGLGR